MKLPEKIKCCPFCGTKNLVETKKKYKCPTCHIGMPKCAWNIRFVDKTAYFYTDAGEISKVEYVGQIFE